jgi:predicted nucleic acid-binding protein
VPGAAKTPVRIYVDTSVFGGCFDPPFSSASRRFFRLVRRGRILVLLSDLVARELRPAPSRVRRILGSMRKEAVREVEISEAVAVLADAYLAAGIVPAASLDDATHVAAATVAGADAIVSWNFRGIVGPERIRGYNRINLRLGYGDLTILTPGEVLPDEEG